MKSKLGIAILTLVSAMGMAEQGATIGGQVGPGPGGPGGPEKHVTMFKRELGAWWKNSQIADKLQLSDQQIKQLEDVFYQHRLKLIDFGAEMEKADMKLQQMLNADTVDESQVNSQVDQVLAARGKMEREFTMLTLNFRKILSPDQWKQLQAIRGDQMHDRIFFHKAVPPGGGPMTLPPPGPQSDLMEPEIDPIGADCQSTEKGGMRIVTCTKRVEIMTDLEHEL
jgi:Spy/CpxP family protein refolding chaperone